MVELFDGWIHALGSLGFLVAGLAAMVEYVFPPFPGDSIIVLAGVYAVRGGRSWPLVFAAVTLGSVIGSSLDYGFGRLIALRVDRRADHKSILGVPLPRIRELQAKMRAKGDWVILLNRFLPGVRSLLFVAAGASRMPLSRVMVLGALSAMGWNLLLFAAGLAVGGNAEELEALLGRYYQAVVALLALLGAAVLGRALYRKRRKQSSRHKVTP
ncbi:MAG: DedA family protein [Myxococcales bacterium]|nr:DedA family protein [Myxococcales bacterium]